MDNTPALPPSAGQRLPQKGYAYADTEMVNLVARCRNGHPHAWRSVVEQFTPLVWTVARSFGLRASDCEDVCQSTWVQVFRSIDRIEEPARLRTWVTTVARRESIKVLESSVHQIPVAEVGRDERGGNASQEPTPEDTAVAQIDHRRVHAALCRLPHQQQILIALLLADPAPSYDEISARLKIPRGSIGPTRNRILRHLRSIMEEDTPGDDAESRRLA